MYSIVQNITIYAATVLKCTHNATFPNFERFPFHKCHFKPLLTRLRHNNSGWHNNWAALSLIFVIVTISAMNTEATSRCDSVGSNSALNIA